MTDALSALISDDDDETGSTVNLNETARKNSQSYAWEYFKYHAQQRQAAFRFYLIIVAASVAAIVPNTTRVAMWIPGIVLLIASFLFWRLDVRNSTLVKLSEAYLKEEEIRLSSEVRSEKIRILHLADRKSESFFFMRGFNSYSQIHRTIFIFVSLTGLALIARSVPIPNLMYIFCKKILAY